MGWAVSHSYVMYRHKNTNLVVWTVTNSQIGKEIDMWIKLVVERVRGQSPGWWPSRFLVDVCDAKHNVNVT
jgi:hypothetical protein